MRTTVFRVEQVGKSYPFHLQRQQNLSLRERLGNHLWQLVSSSRLLIDSPAIQQEPFWALRNVSFEVNQGDSLALIGRNGAGKTTLLKLLANITAPSEGWIESRGRIGTLFSLGSGFHPLMSGRENIYLNGVALGMSVAEVKRKFEEIVAFSELEQSIDMPVKFYSNGMLTRLGFSIFAHLEPEILLIDEALSAGDTGFQRKATAKLAEIRSSGITTIFVSHNLSSIGQLCTTGLLLEKGRLIMSGPVKDVIRHYEMSLLDTQPSNLADNGGSPNKAPKVQVRILDQQAQVEPHLVPGDFVRLRLEFSIPLPISTMAVSVSVRTRQRLLLLHLKRYVTVEAGARLTCSYTLDCVIRQLPLAPGAYIIGVELAEQGQIPYVWENLAILTINRRPVDRQDVRPMPHGLIEVEHCWEEILEEDQQQESI